MKLYFDKLGIHASTVDVSFDGSNNFTTYNKSDLMSGSLDVPDDIPNFSQIVIRGGGVEDTPWYETDSLNGKAIQDKVSKVLIPNGVTSIGGCAFVTCTSLTSINIPNSVTFIEHMAFAGCTGLTSINISSNVTTIGAWALAGCTSLATINYTGTQEQWNAINKGSNWNSGCPANMAINYNYQG